MLDVLVSGGDPLTLPAKVGPYELQDFNLFYITRFGFDARAKTACRSTPAATSTT